MVHFIRMTQQWHHQSNRIINGHRFIAPQPNADQPIAEAREHLLARERDTDEVLALVLLHLLDNFVLNRRR